MKVAIIGSGILAMEMAIKLHELEAYVTLFSKSGELGGKLLRLSKLNPSYIIDGKKIKDFVEEEVLPLSEKIRKFIPIKKVEVIRAGKCFLRPDEEIMGRSRLLDLFRVVYKVDPSEFIKSQEKENPDVYQNFDASVIESLADSMESFEDFDMVVDASGEMENSLFMGPGGGAALNELSYLDKKSMFYGWESEKFLENPTGCNTVIIGRGEAGALAVLKLEGWLKNKENNLIYICEDAHPFENINEGTKKDIDFFMKNQQDLFVKEMEHHREELFKWRELEEYEKAKIPMPPEPTPPFDIRVESCVTSLDRLLDKEGWFLTVESPEFKKVEGFSTFKADNILILRGFKKETSLSEGLQTEYNFTKTRSLNPEGIHQEPGYYTLGGEGLAAGKKQIESILKNMLGFFTKVVD